MQVSPHLPSPLASAWALEIHSISLCPKPTQSSPSELEGAISLLRLLDENEDGNEDEQLYCVITW